MRLTAGAARVRTGDRIAIGLAVTSPPGAPVRDLYVGAGGKVNAAMGHYAPRLADKLAEKVFMPGMESGRPRSGHDALHTPSENLQERGEYRGHVAKSSL